MADHNSSQNEPQLMMPDAPSGSVDTKRQKIVAGVVILLAILVAVFVVATSDGKKKPPKAIANAKPPVSSLTGNNAVNSYEQNLEASIAAHQRDTALAGTPVAVPASGPTPASPFPAPTSTPFQQPMQTSVHAFPGSAPTTPQTRVLGAAQTMPASGSISSYSPGQVGAPGYGPIARPTAGIATAPVVPTVEPNGKPFYMDPQARAAYAYGPNSPQAAAATTGSGTMTMPAQEDELSKEHRKRVYEGRYLTNIAQSKRDQKDAASAARPAASQPFPAPGFSGASGAPFANPQGAPGASPSTSDTSGASNRAQSISRVAEGTSDRKKRPERAPGTYYIPEGTTLSCVLQNRLSSDFSGPVKVMVSEPLYDRARERVLVPAGTILLGEEKAVTKLGQSRLAVSFHRLLRPDGYNADLDTFTGLDQIGETALADKVNHHYVQVFGISIALGAISGLSNASTSAGYNQNGTDQFRQGFSQSLDNSAVRILDKYTNILPTVIIREGTRVKVYFTNDLYLPPATTYPILD